MGPGLRRDDSSAGLVTTVRVVGQRSRRSIPGRDKEFISCLRHLQADWSTGIGDLVL